MSNDNFNKDMMIHAQRRTVKVKNRRANKTKIQFNPWLTFSTFKTLLFDLGTQKELKLLFSFKI